MSNQQEAASGVYEYTFYQRDITNLLQIFSLREMSSTYYTAQETLDLLHFLQSHQSEIEEAASKQAEVARQPKRQKTIQEQIDDLF